MAFAGLSAGLCYFVWGDRIRRVDVARACRWSTAVAAAIGFLVGWWMTREKIRPMEENPVSRFVRWLYAGRLRLALQAQAADAVASRR